MQDEESDSHFNDDIRKVCVAALDLRKKAFMLMNTKKIMLFFPKNSGDVDNDEDDNGEDEDEDLDVDVNNENKEGEINFDKFYVASNQQQINLKLVIKIQVKESICAYIIINYS